MYVSEHGSHFLYVFAVVPPSSFLVVSKDTRFAARTAVRRQALRRQALRRTVPTRSNWLRSVLGPERATTGTVPSGNSRTLDASVNGPGAVYPPRSVVPPFPPRPGADGRRTPGAGVRADKPAYGRSADRTESSTESSNGAIHRALRPA
jgi:hypothetical protein